MHAELRDPEDHHATQLASVPFEAFARDSDGNVYFAPGQRWLRIRAVSGQVENFGDFNVEVTRLPAGSNIMLTSER